MQESAQYLQDGMTSVNICLLLPIASNITIRQEDPGATVIKNRDFQASLQ